jgi:predicted enzyme related to lactoylglutathione lyase
MSTQILGLRTTIYKVTDLAEAKKWYAEAFATEPYFDEPFYVGFNIAGYELGLMPDEQAAADKSTNVLTYWGVGDVEAAVQRLIEKGASAHEKPTKVGGDIVVGAVRDPWGNVVGVIDNPAFKAD